MKQVIPGEELNISYYESINLIEIQNLMIYPLFNGFVKHLDV